MAELVVVRWGRGGWGRWGKKSAMAMQQATPKLSVMKQQPFVISHQPMVPLGSSATPDQS